MYKYITMNDFHIRSKQMTMLFNNFENLSRVSLSSNVLSSDVSINIKLRNLKIHICFSKFTIVKYINSIFNNNGNNL